MKKPAGASCVKAPFPAQKSPSFSHKDECGSSHANFERPVVLADRSNRGCVCGAFLSICIGIVHDASLQELHPADAIVVFGAAEYAGRPSPVYRARLDHAYELFRRGIAPVVITSGGAAADPNFSEGGVGHD